MKRHLLSADYNIELDPLEMGNLRRSRKINEALDRLLSHECIKSISINNHSVGVSVEGTEADVMITWIEKVLIKYIK